MTPAGKVTLLLDGQPHMVAAGTTLAALVAALGHAPEQVATAVNGRFVPRADRATRGLHASDEVLLFQPIVGG